jgi:endonuclease/exonuclease/phosphatase family metal-dependent hydrolase
LGCGFVIAIAIAFATQPPAVPADFNKVRQTNVISPDATLNSLRIVSWNIDRGTELDQITSGLQRESADLCLLQEVDWNTARAGNVEEAAELAKRLHLNASYGIEFEELSQEQAGSHSAFIGQATLTKLPLQNARVLRFERQSGFWQPNGWLPSSSPLMQRRLGNRIGLVTDLEFNGRPLVVYNLHLESRSMGMIQSGQLNEVLADLAKYPPNTAALIGGDLNTKYLPKIFLHKLERAGFHSSTGERIERSHKIAMALDWIFVRGPLRFESGQVLKDIKGSDHYPVYAKLVLE